MQELNLLQQLTMEITEQRKKRSLSIKKLAKIADISETTIRKIETGNYNFNIETLWKLCKAFKMRPCDLVKKATQKNRHP